MYVRSRLREAVRRSRSRPILERLHRTFLLLQNRRYHLPKSLLGKALAYALGQWPMLTVFVDKGRVEIDNNLCENAIRPLKLGAKNCLHSIPAMRGADSSSGVRLIDAAFRQSIGCSSGPKRRAGAVP